jgi:hypothetical protein
MFTRSITERERQDIARKKQEFSERLYKLQNNNTFNHLPTISQIKTAENVSNEFDNIKEQSLHEITRFLNIATQLAQLNKSKVNQNKVNSDFQKVKSMLSSVSPDDNAQSVFKKMSNSIILLSQMLVNSSAVSRNSTISSVANAILTKDVSKKLDRITKRR